MTRFVRFAVAGEVNLGILEDSSVRVIEGDFFSDWRPTDKIYSLNLVKLLPPVTPSKIVCIGLNYHANVKALKASVPEEPVIFLKPPSAIVGPGENIIHPSDVLELAYEVELAVVMKDTVKNVSRDEALNHVLGYTCANDLTAKDKMTGGPWTKAKSYDTFLPLGPYIATGLDPDSLTLEMFLNGEKTQSSNTSDMVFKVADLIAYASQIMTLSPGDVLSTGTPPGAGILKPGDRVEARIEGIGSLQNLVVKEEI
ncbi:fumarylacetoacetate hydrolase family protein [Desulfosporosinus burensis]